MIRKAYYVSEPQLESIKNICNSTGLSEAEIIRRAIDFYIESNKSKYENQYNTKCGIYALIDPRNNKVMYIGQSVDIEKRYQSHKSTSRYDFSIKFNWVKDLEMIGLDPTLKIIKECTMFELDECEIEAIKYYKSIGQAELNMSAGGPARRPSKTLNTAPEEWFQIGQQLQEGYRILSHAMIVLSAMIGTSKGEKYINMFNDFYGKMTNYIDSQIFLLFPSRASEIVRILNKNRRNSPEDFPVDPPSL